MVIDFSPFFAGRPQLERLFDRRWPLAGGWPAQPVFPLLNVSHDETAIYMHCRLPGVNIEDVELILAGDTLTIKGERKPVQGRYYRQERPSGPFQRVATINAPIDQDAIRATLKDGILAIVLPKAAPSAPRTIAIATP
ncbi:Hsp20/alpha crystallin family protein [Megalodesulfovibrio gigas]|uniref:Putative heat shock protein Hsp20 n=1 Tax=Megalodesulfovibrio gigas (strain ATCC 19364 / DSM 1382 / NCIMB 9332 / VKM B-1759) TaxID=1121448 RepID=T2GF80_MEGG1|nr:Hsp20/alpha crystallin family protein [Megalodesulfovibrio gigas]AGW14786.1 putative heat shock protein Hsp20 [Megalodesulfovibrio gigas DSM 1382 = ATCC 19364]